MSLPGKVYAAASGDAVIAFALSPKIAEQLHVRGGDKLYVQVGTVSVLPTTLALRLRRASSQDLATVPSYRHRNQVRFNIHKDFLPDVRVPDAPTALSWIEFNETLYIDVGPLKNHLQASA